MTKYTMLKTLPGSRDGIRVETFHKGQTYDLNPELAEQFYHEGAVEEVNGTPADKREKKVTGLQETKVTGVTETKEGEAGVDLATQNIEELVALARDTYGLEVDSTMSEDDLKALIELAQEEASEADGTAKGTTKKQKKHK